MKCYGVRLREHSGSTLRTEFLYIKKNPPSPPQNPQKKKKKTEPLEPSHWLHEISISKMVSHHFQPGLHIVLLKEGNSDQGIKSISEWVARRSVVTPHCNGIPYTIMILTPNLKHQHPPYHHTIEKRCRYQKL
jgi:hypothetical protein